MSAAPATWPDAVWVAALLALDPIGFGGVHVRATNGPEREMWLALTTKIAPADMPIRRCPLSIDQDRLLGGLDLAASLALGQSVRQKGLLAECHAGLVLLQMADSLSDSVGAQIAHRMDDHAADSAQFGIVLLDEGSNEETVAPTALIERCAFALDNEGLTAFYRAKDQRDPTHIMAALSPARASLPTPLDAEQIETLVAVAQTFGIETARAPVFACRVASGVARILGHTQITPEDIALAACLTFAHRATRLPEASHEEQQPEPPEGDEELSDASDTDTQVTENTESQSSDTANQTPEDILTEIVTASLPAHIIAALMGASNQTSRARSRAGRGSGDKTISAKRGRPTGSRRGSLSSSNRLHVIDTLRAAAPWQKLRRGSIFANDIDSRTNPLSAPLGRESTAPIKPGIIISRDDIRLRRFVEKRETTIIFAVDASGSSAWQRLNEAKGAVQVMLSRAYQTRARVALVAFRNRQAEMVLPPTRSLTRARRMLGDMVGGGGTPLASGIEMALSLALGEKAKGRTPRILLLSDGQANVARDGTAGRAQAQSDGFAMARQVRASGIQTIHIDTSPRARPQANDLARQMGARYAPLPTARAKDLAQVMGGVV